MDSCKRLRIMKGSEAIGLGIRTMHIYMFIIIFTLLFMSLYISNLSIKDQVKHYLDFFTFCI